MKQKIRISLLFLFVFLVVRVSGRNSVLTTLCQNTDYPKFCHQVLSPITTNASNTTDFVEAMMKTSMDSVIKALNISMKLTEEYEDDVPEIKMALQNCNYMLEFAIDELKDSNKHAAKLNDRLGAVIAYQQTCLEGFFDTDDDEKHFKSQVENVGKLIELALDIVSHVFNNSNEEEVDVEGYPTWLAVDDLLSNGVEEPNAIVAKDGSGNFKTVNDAINSYPKNHRGRYVIYVKSGIYHEYITVDKKKPNILLYGDGSSKTIITGHKSVNYDHVKTMNTATFSTEASDFTAKSIGFENTIGPEGGQAVALRVQGDRSAFFNCAMRSHQDTLYVHANKQFYRDCEISGTIDIIFGHSIALIQNSKILLRKPGKDQQVNVVVADGRPNGKVSGGIVIQNCQIMADAELLSERLTTTVKSYLARPWHPFSRAVFIENFIGDLIQPLGYIPMPTPTQPNTQNSYFAEFGNTGPGANTSGRAKWGKGIISKNEAAQFTAQPWLQATHWLPFTKIPYDPGFTNHP